MLKYQFLRKLIWEMSDSPERNRMLWGAMTDVDGWMDGAARRYQCTRIDAEGSYEFNVCIVFYTYWGDARVPWLTGSNQLLAPRAARAMVLQPNLHSRNGLRSFFAKGFAFLKGQSSKVWEGCSKWSLFELPLVASQCPGRWQWRCLSGARMGDSGPVACNAPRPLLQQWFLQAFWTGVLQHRFFSAFGEASRNGFLPWFFFAQCRAMLWRRFPRRWLCNWRSRQYPKYNANIPKYNTNILNIRQIS